MDYIITIIIGVIGLISSLAALFAGIGYFKQGKNQGKIDANTLQKQDIEALTKKVNDQEQDIKKLTDKVNQLTKAIEEKDKKLAEVIDILQGRDPNMVEFIKEVREYMVIATPLVDKINETILPTIEKMDKFLNKQSF